MHLLYFNTFTMQNFSFLERLKASLVDFTVIFSLYTIIRFAISFLIFLPFLMGLFCSILLYYLLCYSVWKTTLGVSFFEGTLVRSDEKKVRWLTVMIRELFTSIPAYLLLGYWMIYLYGYYINLPKPAGLSNSGYIFLFNLLPFIMLVLTIWQKRIFRLKLKKSAIKKEKTHLIILRRNILTICTIALVLAGIIRIIHTYSTNNRKQITKNFIWTAPRPSLNSVKKYTLYLEQNRKNINDYIFELYQKYDHIILCERYHPELTQYNMIFDIISDQRFIDSVRVVFTEVGNVDSRDDYIKFLNNSYSSDTTLNRELAAFLVTNASTSVFWSKTNWFQFLKKVYYLNHGKNKSNQIRIAFSGIRPPWQTLSNEITDRDSLMADNIISTIRSDSLKKTLTIMNSRHAYLINDNKLENCGYFIQKAFPNKVANILINSRARNYGNDQIVITYPISQGRWDVAFENMPDSAFAFNLKGSPFGNDRFDLHYSKASSVLSTKNYSDMFTGVIFYLQLDKHIMSEGYPYMFDEENKNKILQHAALLGENYYNEVKNKEIPYYSKFGNGGLRDLNRVYFITNQLENIIFICFYILGIVIYSILCIHYCLPKNQNVKINQ